MFLWKNLKGNIMELNYILHSRERTFIQYFNTVVTLYGDIHLKVYNEFDISCEITMPALMKSKRRQITKSISIETEKILFYHNNQ